MDPNRIVELSSGATHVRSEGEGRALVWTHGFLASIELEEKLGLSALLQRLPGVRLVRYDARGHGHSAPARTEAAQSWEALGGDLLELADALALERAVAGGASMGVAATLHAATRAPTRFAGMLLLVPPTAWETRKAQADLYRAGAALVEARGVGAYLDAMRAGFRARPLPGFTDEMQEALVHGLGQKSAGDLVRLLRGAAGSDLPDPQLLRSLALPTLILATRDDPGHPLSTAERIAELVLGAELVVLRDLREAAAAREAVLRFLARLP